ncbi:Brp/Blh family beta-carotene 15,15'-dioxygenase [Pelagibacteraceae bacterium]|nr:Brp/Blh family beta-carotene 15,15'-dioxygenase [Pelagibacteraceae bacterium]
MFKKFNYSRTVLTHGARFFFFFTFSFFWWSENINLFFTIPVCFFLILTFGISHGALDHIKGKKVLNFYKMNNILIFYISYLAISFFILIFWFFLPTASLSIFLLVASYHFGKEDSEIMEPYESIFLKFIFFIKGSLIISAPLIFHFNETIAIFELLNFDIYYLSLLNNEGIIRIFFYSSLISNMYFLIGKGNVRANGELVFFDLFSINLLYYFLSPLVAFTLYFCFIHSFRHSVSLINQLNEKNFKKGFKKFVRKSLPLTVITAILFLFTVFFLNSYYVLEAAISKVIFIGLASLTFPHILLEYLLEKNEK